MMIILDIASIVFVCVTMNHLGLISTIEGIIKHSLPVVNCPKCASFWSVFVYGMAEVDSSLFTLHSSLRLLAISFLASYSALWLELLEGFIDTLYTKLYDTIYPTTDTSDTDT